MAGLKLCPCIHGISAQENSIGEIIVYCESSGEWANVTLGECYGNCEAEEHRAGEEEQDG